jgi:type II secretion system protein N
VDNHSVAQPSVDKRILEESESNNVSAFGALTSLKKPLRFEDGEWNQELPRRRTSPVVRVLLYLGTAVFFFFFFLYLTFPSMIIREVVTTQLTKTIQDNGLPLRISIGQLKPYWFTGLSLKNVQIINVSEPNAALKFGELNVRAEVLPLFWGKISVKAYASQAGGSMDARVQLPLLGIAKGAGPSEVRVNFKSFSLDDIFEHLFAIGRNSKNPALILVQPLLAKSSAGGSLTGKIEMDNPDPLTFSSLKGLVNLNIGSSFLHINDETLQIPKQTFEKSKIDVTFGGNTVQIGKETAFKAEDIGIELSGQVGLPEQAGEQPNASLNLVLTMKGQIEKSLGFIVPNMMRCKQLENGELNAKLSGPLSALNCS